MKEFFAFCLGLAFVFVVLWFPCWLVSFIRSKRVRVDSNKWYQLRYNPFLDRFTVNGKVVQPGREILVCLPFLSYSSFERLILQPTFFGWKLTYPLGKRVKVDLNGLWVCLEERARVCKNTEYGSDDLLFDEESEADHG